MALVVVFVIIRVLRLLRLLLARIGFTVHRYRVPFRLPIVLIDIGFLVLTSSPRDDEAESVGYDF